MFENAGYVFSKNIICLFLFIYLMFNIYYTTSMSIFKLNFPNYIFSMFMVFCILIFTFIISFVVSIFTFKVEFKK